MENKKSFINYAWGTQGRGRVHIKRDSTAVKILKGVAIAGMVVVAASSPYFVPNLLRAIDRNKRKKEWREFNQSLRYLKSRGYVRFLKETPEGAKVEITRTGQRVVKHVDIASLKLEPRQTWDRKWRVIVFDVPNYKSKNRTAFRERIKELGFWQAQKSVWVYPHECREAVMLLRKFYDIEQHVTYLETTHTEDEDLWLQKFHMEN